MLGSITVNDSKAVASGLPSKGNYLVVLVIQFKHLNWDVFFPDSIQLEPSKNALLCFCVPIYLDSKIFSIALPVHLTIAHTEKVFLPQLLFARNLHKAHLARQSTYYLLRY
jgi:hypothetical protein